MTLQLESYVGELEELRKRVELYQRVVKHTVLSDKLGDVYFICGEAGEKDTNNLPEKILICPAYGVDWFQVYERTDRTAGPEW